MPSLMEVSLKNAIAEKERLRAENDRLRVALEPFALIGLDILKNRPGWANNAFAGEWCGYKITYTQFEAAAAAVIANEIADQSR